MLGTCGVTRRAERPWVGAGGWLVLARRTSVCSGGGAWRPVPFRSPLFSCVKDRLHRN